MNRLEGVMVVATIVGRGESKELDSRLTEEEFVDL